jgi:hypothetical protein
MSLRAFFLCFFMGGCGPEPYIRSYELLAIADPGHIVDMRWVQGNDGLLANQGTVQFARWSQDTADLQYRRRTLPQDTTWDRRRFQIGPDRLQLDPNSIRASIRSDSLSSSVELRNAQALGSHASNEWTQRWSRVPVDGWVESNGQGGRIHAKGIWVESEGTQPPTGRRELIWLRTPDGELLWTTNGAGVWGQFIPIDQEPIPLAELTIEIQGRRLLLSTADLGLQWEVQITSLGGDQELFPELSPPERLIAHQLRRQQYRSIRYLRGERGNEIDGLWLNMGDTPPFSLARNSNRNPAQRPSDSPAAGGLPAYDRPANPEEP